MKFVISLGLMCILLPILFLVIFTPKPCDHENIATQYLFTSYKSTADNNMATVCKDCGDRLTYWKPFKGTLVDQSYLSAIQEHSDGSEIVPGEYYTVTATVPQGFSNYSSSRVSLTCRVQNADYIVSFNVEFREEFKETVKSVEEGAEITFRGRFYDESCGFTDGELINIK